VGVGFRATTAPASSTKGQVLSLKLGYREERQVPLASLVSKGIKLTAARLEGRSKATLINVEGTDLEQVHQVSANLRKLRVPDSYKGKGIQYDQEKLSLKKGKRE
jgi:large subunit ribosomal protein L6